MCLWAGREFLPQQGEQTAPNQLIIHVKAGANVAAVVAAVAPGSQIVSKQGSDTHLVQVSSRPTADASHDFANHPLVDYVEPNRIRRFAALPSLNDPSANVQWALTAVRAALAWNIIPDRYFTSATAGTGRVLVAILDTGGDCTHPDFANSGGSSVDAAQGGQISMALSQAFIATTISPAVCAWQDDYGHGTHVMGIVAAATQNGTGVASLGYPLEIVGYKVMDSSGSGDDFTISNAIKAAANAGIHFVSLSLGGAGYSQTFQDAINYAWQRNTLVIAAAGNNNSSALFFPAGANHAIGVAATDSNNNRAGFSNFGNSVDIAAPGVNIFSTAPTYSTPIGIQTYGYLSGTSMATPHVSALAGMIALTTPNFSVASIAQRIQQSADSSFAGGGWDQYMGYGIIDAWQAVSGNLRPAAVGGIAGQVTDNNGLPLVATVIAGGQTFATAADGLYRIQNLTAGSYTVTASAAGFTTQNLTVVVPPGADTALTVAMGIVTGSFTGTVTTGGAPSAGAIVQALSAGLIIGTAVTGSNGLYTLYVPPGSYTVQVSGISGVTSASTIQTVAANGSTTVNLSLPKMGVITGTAQDGNSNPVANAQLTFTQNGISVGATADAGGHYLSIGLPAGTYTVTASATGLPTASVSGVVVGSDTVTTVNPQLTQHLGGGPTGTATFVKVDPGTEGNWKGIYGANGYNIVGDTVSYPSYVNVTPSGNFTYIWAPSTADPRALQKVSAPSDRIAGTWYSSGAFTIDLVFSDQATHQVAMYCLDWDTGSRAQTITVQDANGLTLDTRSMANFNNGQYIIWTLSGHVRLVVASTAGFNAVVGGLFFDAPAGGGGGGGGGGGIGTSGTAAFVKLDTTTRGNWKGAYGADGYNVIGDIASYPSYVAVSPAGALSYVWLSSTTDTRALQKASLPTDRIAATWYSASSFTVDLAFNDQASHQIALYSLDWEAAGRMQTVTVQDGNGVALNTQSMTSFPFGQYLVWKVSGHVRLQVSSTGGPNAVLSGLFFDTPGSAGTGGTVTTGTATFVRTDSNTRGSWKGVYGTNGYNVIGDSASYPAYVNVTPAGNPTYVWAASTSDPRALQKAAFSTDRIAGTWYTPNLSAAGNFTIDLAFSDQGMHQLAVYCVDWDGSARAQTITLQDANGLVLDSRSMANFNGGQYLVWNLSGRVRLLVAWAGGYNAVVSGLFF